ncbi:hypothetical protein C0992_010015 [Termitomyces sp. T32_za158]|nr:hypothetical protein C0992_010015 [Termitomyces sp. T32_za158]
MYIHYFLTCSPAIKDLGAFNFNDSQTLPPFSVDQDFNLLNAQLSCPPITASLTVDVDAKANFVAAIGVAASGTIIPPTVEDFSVIISERSFSTKSPTKASLDMSGDINGTASMKATASGTLDSGKLKIFEQGIPGLDFPGILTIGPTFEVDAQASASLNLQADTTVGLDYSLDNAQLTFPPNSDQTNNAGNAFTIGDTPLKLSVSPSVQATGTVQAHLTPSLNLKVSALDVVDAGIFLTLDASAEMSLSIGAGAQASTTVDKKKRERLRTLGRYMPRDAIVAAEVPPTTAFDSVKSVAKLSTGGDSVSLGGCVKVDAGLNVNAGANGDFFGLFNANTKVPLFNKTFEILQECFGNQKRSLAVSSSLTRTSLELEMRAVGLTCPAAGSPPKVKVFDQVVQANS